MKKFIFWVFCFGFGGALAFGLVQLVTVLSPFELTENANEVTQRIDYTDFVSIMLTGVSLILASLGFVVALLAVVGWKSIEEKVAASTAILIKKSLEENGQLHGLVQTSLEDGELYELVKKEAKTIIYRGISPVGSNEQGEDEEYQS